jgi:hypothetical protein
MKALRETITANSFTTEINGSLQTVTRAECEHWLQGMNIARRLFPNSGQEKQPELVNDKDCPVVLA